MMLRAKAFLTASVCAAALMGLLLVGACAPTPNVPSPAVHRAPPPAPGGTGFVVTSALNLRQCPSTQCSILAVLRRAEAVTVMENKGGWSRIKSQDSQREGWVASRYISKEPGAASSQTGKGADEPPPLPKEQWSKPAAGQDKPAAPKEEFAR